MMQINLFSGFVSHSLDISPQKAMAYMEEEKTFIMSAFMVIPLLVPKKLKKRQIKRYKHYKKIRKIASRSYIRFTNKKHAN